MRSSLLLVALVIGVTCVSADAKVIKRAPPPGETYLIIGATGVDDMGEAWINGRLAGRCTWTANPGCSFRVRIDLHGARKARVRFRLTNYVYRSFCLQGPCGKYAANFWIKSVTAGRTKTEWSKTIYCHAKSCPGGNSSGVKFDETLDWAKD